MKCERCGADHLEIGVTAKEIPEEWCRGALVSEAAFQASLYRDAAAARDKHFAKVKELELQIDELRGLAHALNLFVGVYDGKVLDKDAALHLIKKYAKGSEAVGKEIIEYQDQRDVANRLNGEYRLALEKIAKAEGGGLDLTKTLVCRESVDLGHGDVFECGNPLPCTNPIHVKKQQNEKRNCANPKHYQPCNCGDK